MPKLIVTSTVVGRRRGGAQFVGAMAFELDHFTKPQLTEIVNDPVLTVTVGEVVTAQNVDEYFEQLALRAAVADEGAEKVAAGAARAPAKVKGA